MKQALTAILLFALLAGGIFYNIRSRNQPPASAATEDGRGAPVPTAYTVSKGINLKPMVQTISALGVVMADRQAVVTAKVPARISSIAVHAGDTVRAGSPLICLDDRDLKTQVQSATSAVDAAEAQLRKAEVGKRARGTEMTAKTADARAGLTTALAKLHQAELGLQLTSSSAASDWERAEGAVRQAEAGLKQAESGLSQAEDSAKRLKFLYDRGGLAKVDYEGALTQLDIALAQRDSARAALDQAKAAAKPASESAPLRKRVGEAEVEAAKAGVHQAQEGLRSARRAEAEAMALADRDIEAARAQVSQAKAGMELTRSQAAGAVIGSPQDGVIVDLSAHEGEIAQPGQPLLTVASLGSLFVEANVPIRQSSRVRAGTNARIRADNYPGRLYRGAVSRVLPTATDGRSLTVQVLLQGSRSGLIPGLGVNVQFELEATANQRK